MKHFFPLLFCGILFAATITARAQSGTDGSISWGLANGTLTISGNGAMRNYTNNYPDSLSVRTPQWGKYRYLITSVVINSGITAIGEYAFWDCTNLVSVIIPNSVDVIGIHSFSACTGLTEIINHATTPQTIDANVFEGVNKTVCTLRVPAASISTYEGVNVWKDFLNKVAIAGTTPVITIDYQSVESATFTQGGISGSLIVEASVTQGATLSYQWYVNYTNSNTTEGSSLGADARNSTLVIPTTLTPGTYYYYCVVSATGGATSVTSDVAMIRVNAIPAVISIRVHPEPATVTQGSISGFLSITATVTPSTTLHYQWYQNSTNSSTGGTSLGSAGGAQTNTLTIPTTLTAGGNYFYYCTVSASGATSVTSNVARVTVNPPIPVITIYMQPNESITVTQDYISTRLYVSAYSTPNAPLSYRWYRSTDGTNAGGIPVTEIADYPAFDIPTDLTVEGSPYFFYCMVSAPDGAIPVNSRVAKVTVQQHPVITIDKQPALVDQLIWLEEGKFEEVVLTVEASSIPDAELTYQWYEMTAEREYNAWFHWKLPNATPEFKIHPSTLAGRYFYFCMVSALGANPVRTNTVDIRVTGGKASVYCTDPIILPRGDDNFNYTLCEDGTLYISGNGDMPDFAYDSYNNIFSSPWSDYHDKITSVVINSGITSIGDYAFSGCYELTSVIIPEGATSIGDGAFNGCERLTNISIPKSVQSIGEEAFANCIRLAKIEIPEGVKYISYGMFSNCYSLTSVTIPAGIETISYFAFYNCTRLNTVSIPESVKSIYHGAFMLCEGLRSFYVHWSSPLLNVESSSFDYTNTKIITLFVPTGTENKYSTANVWKEFIIREWEEGTGSVGGSITMGPVMTPSAALWRLGGFGVLSVKGTTNLSALEGYEFVMSTPVNADGTYQFDHLPPGMYIVVIVMDDVESVPSQPITLKESETVSKVNFSVNDDGTITPDNTVITGVEDVWNNELKIYPNPFTGAVHIVGAVETLRATSLRVINAAGVIVHTQQITNPNETIRLEHLPAGIYIFRLEKDGKPQTIKVVKMN